VFGTPSTGNSPHALRFRPLRHAACSNRINANRTTS
jgi:hypothetical protein